MKTIVLAYHDIGCAGIEALLRNGFEIAAVFTHKDDPNEKIWFNSVAQLAASHGIPVFAPQDINHPLWVKKIKEYQPEIIFSFYYRNLVKSPILEIPTKGCLNLHGSLLPKYRGRCPINWVLVNGEKETGVTLHHMTPRADNGDMVCQRKITISDEDTAISLHGKAVKASGAMLDEILPRIKDGSAPATPQNHTDATYFGGRKPKDGEIDWNKNATAVKNLVRAVTYPYPGAFSYLGDKKIIFWQVSESADKNKSTPGSVISTNPFLITANNSTIQVDFAQTEGGIYMSGEQLAKELNLSVGMKFGASVSCRINACKKKKVLILGANGFIGNALCERLLESGKYEIHGMDVNSQHISRFLHEPNVHFYEGDISINQEWVEYHIRKCDIILPLVAIATPIEYSRNPLRVFELDFEENLKIVRYCVKYKKRLIFPSTSEVYGMCEDKEFDEENSKLVLGPINKQRWIYSCIKQLLDRVIWAYGQKDGLSFTLFRPFNWIGPRLDSLMSARIGSSRVITQLILNLVEGTPIQLVDGGNQKRCFTDVADGIECLFRIIENPNSICDGRIINIGNPDNEASIRQLAQILVDKFEQHPDRAKFPAFAGMRDIESGLYYGEGYQDLDMRKPSIRNAKKLLNWTPAVSLEQSVESTLDFSLKEALNSPE